MKRFPPDMIIKNVDEGSRNDTHVLIVVLDSLHGESLAGASLPICKDRPIKSH